MARISIPNKVFIGCPFKNIRSRYLLISSNLTHEYPLFFFLIGQERDQKAQDLFNLIKENINSASGAIFDVTGNNANVSLEYGYAEGQGIPKCIYLNDSQRSNKSKKESSIIADLVGQVRNHYKAQNGLNRLLITYCKEHPFTIRFEKVISQVNRNVKDGRRKRKLKGLALRLVHYLDGKEEVRREDLANHLATMYESEDIERMLKGLRKNKIINSSQGPYSKVSMRQL